MPLLSLTPAEVDSFFYTLQGMFLAGFVLGVVVVVLLVLFVLIDRL